MAVFPSIKIEGGLLGPDVLDQLIAGDLTGQRAADFGLDGRRNLTDEIAAIFADARALWQVFQHRLQRLPADDIATSVTRDSWMIPFLGLLGYELKYNPRAIEVDDLTFAISHRAGEPEDTPPVHIVGARQELGRIAATGRPRLAPHSLVQEYLNRTDHVWGIVTNGLTLRLLRDSTFVRRQAYLEFDLQAIIEEQRFQDFGAFYRLLHRSRLPRGMADASDCLLEKYYDHSVEQGGRVRDHLRDGVEECIKSFANGFLRHQANEELRRRVSNAAIDSDRISSDMLYRQLLRLVYRFLFLLVSEDRGLLSTDSIYREHYGISRVRRLIDQRAAYTDDDDIWQSLRVLWHIFGKDQLAEILKLAPLNGELFAPQPLDNCTISNRDLLEAFWYLTWYQENRTTPPRRVNYAALNVEELGSVYESLLEFHPHIDEIGNSFTFDLLVEGRERRSTGSHYTPPELVAPLIKNALEPVLADRLRTARTKEQKEKAILSLKICDISCGSGHFLLAAARCCGKELARVRTGEDEPAPERVREAIRDVITHCIYGVDKNPLAVELCRVALWIESNTAGKPLTFLDHRIRCGDSLVGVFDLQALEHGIPDEAFKPVAGDDKTVARETKKNNAIERREVLFHAPFAEQLTRIADSMRSLDELPEDTIEQVRIKAEAYRRIELSPEFERLSLACDVWSASFFQPFPNSSGGQLTTDVLREALTSGRVGGRSEGFVLQSAIERRFFHWHLAFPEVFAGGGFDVILGNPPFLGGLKISTEFGNKYRYWVSVAFVPFPGTADICAAFFRRAFNTVNASGHIGLISTNTISQGDTREAGLAPIKREGGSIVFAQRYVKWPGQANVEVNLVSLGKRIEAYKVNLDGQVVMEISSRLDAEPESEALPILQNRNRCFIGDYVRGIGFVIEKDEAGHLLVENANNSQCLMPYLGGEDFNDDCQQRPARYVICFHDYTFEQAQQFHSLLEIVEERVKPFRSSVKEKIEREKWWLFARYRGELRQAVSGLTRFMVRSRVSEYHMLGFISPGLVCSDATVVLAFDDFYHFALLQSNIHEAWVRRNASTMRTDIRYTPSDCFETFAFPQDVDAGARAEAERLGEQYHEYRRQVMLNRQLGLTKTYNLFHRPDCTDEDISRLRDLHSEMDRAILACYSWTDLNPEQGFHVNERGQSRFTISPNARREILRRLLALNLEVARREANGRTLDE